MDDLVRRLPVAGRRRSHFGLLAGFFGFSPQGAGFGFPKKVANAWMSQKGCFLGGFEEGSRRVAAWRPAGFWQGSGGFAKNPLGLARVVTRSPVGFRKVFQKALIRNQHINLGYTYLG